MKKTITKKITLLSMILTVVVVFAGCGSDPEKSKEYTAAGMTITLPDNFEEKDRESVTYYLQSKDAIVTALKEDATAEQAESITLDQYTDAVIRSNNMLMNKTATGSANGQYKFITYEMTQNDIDYYYVIATFKHTDAFWLFNVACETKNKDEYESKFKTWLDSVKFE